MIKQEAIRKINTLGKIGAIVSCILKILTIAVSICVLVTTILFMVLPKDFLTMEIEGNGTINVNLPQIMGQLTSEQIAEAQQQIAEYNEQERNDHLSVNANEMDIVFTELTPNGVRATTHGNYMSFSSSEIRVTLFLVLLYLIMGIITLAFVEKLCRAFQTCETPFADDVILRMRNTAYCLIPLAVMSSVTDSFSSCILGGGFSFNLTINVSLILVTLVLLALTYIFKYGAVLQRESDETL